jgi:hypothetical protein
VDPPDQVLARRDLAAVAELGYGVVYVLVVQDVDHPFGHLAVELREVDDEAGLRIGLPGYRDVEPLVVTVAR